ncbi:uncharacterized protein HD556DRAFT_1346965 [Suillus plorans]|uniref:Secreted protein n=1 Tax=Suillus plorans TaxID=116603 RepID=A0A9P7J2I9_9AGAM|nr:uncharacterized protein HD556DRAFT_1346965 [Suillus plorans]KAG1799322.1 hypothetical protein HD556DRAFT_1346965 [Suillus plorans]
MYKLLVSFLLLEVQLCNSFSALCSALHDSEYSSFITITLILQVGNINLTSFVSYPSTEIVSSGPTDPNVLASMSSCISETINDYSH